MKSFSDEISPIKHTKYYPISLNADYDRQKDRDFSCIIKSKGHQTYHINLIPPYEQQIKAAAKAIIYLFSPEIDIIDNIQSDFSNYDKFHKSKEILNQLIYRFRNIHSDLEYQIISLSEEINHLLVQNRELKQEIKKINQERDSKDQQNAKYKEVIISLSKAYYEAKECFQKEMFQMKLANNELRRLYEREVEKKQLNVKSIEKIEQKKRSKSKQKLKEVTYADKSLTKRFSVSRFQETKKQLESSNQQKNLSQNDDLSLVLNISKIKSPHKNQQKSSKKTLQPRQSNSQPHHQHPYQHQSKGNDANQWTNNLIMLQQRCRLFQQSIDELQQKKERQIGELRKIIDDKNERLQKCQRKVKEKNRIIIDLMNQIQRQ